MTRHLAWLLSLTLFACGTEPADEGVDTDSDTDVAPPDPISLPDVVQTGVGPVRGYRRQGEGAYMGFVGVPYAAPPVGALRFAAPAPVTPWTEPFDGSDPPALTSAKCPQRLPIIGDVTTEDCLRLNIHVPDPVTPGSPVMVWLHGGGFTVGEGLQAGGGTSGHVLAGYGDVVVVSLNYRLGALGWLASEALQDGEGRVGNYGYLDVLAGLRWVHDHIEAFGGDPDNVTVVGQSAGGGLVCMLLVDGNAEGLFHKAIVQSADCRIDTTVAQAQADAAAYVEAVGCDEADDVAACLREVDVQDMIDVQFGSSEGQTLGSLSWGPVVDGVTVPLAPRDLFARLPPGGLGVPVVWGMTAEEGNAAVVTGGGPDLVDDDGAWRAALEARFGVTGPPIDDILALYPLSAYRGRFADVDEVTVSAATWAMVGLDGDEGTACATRSALSALADKTSLYAYVFSYQDATWPLVGRGYGAFHFADVQYVFGIHPEFLFAKTFEPEEVTLHEAIRGYWTSFARTGVPQGPTTWPVWSTAGDAWLQLDTDLSVVTQAKKAECAAFVAARAR